MALIRCAECKRDISDQATSCPGCGAPVTVGQNTVRAPESLSLVGGNFVATRDVMAELAKSAVLACGYRVDSADDTAGTVTFTTGMTMGSWTGVSGTIVFREVSPYQFEVSGAAKQNVRGGQVVALDLFGEAKGKVDNVIQEMKRQASNGNLVPPSANAGGNSGLGCSVLVIALGVAPSVWAIGQFV